MCHRRLTTQWACRSVDGVRDPAGGEKDHRHREQRETGPAGSVRSEVDVVQVAKDAGRGDNVT